VSAPPLPYFDVHDGDGPYLLLVHGFLSSRAQWRLNLPALSRFSRPVVVELYGHGRSPSPQDAAAYTPAGYVAAFERIREQLRAGRWLVCGQSLGAALTLRYALDCPQRVVAQACTNSNSAFAEDGWGERIRPGLQAQAQRLAAEGRAALAQHPLNPARSARMTAMLRDEFAADMALHDPRGIAMTGLHTVPDSPVRSRVIESRVPALLVVGRREQRFAEHARWAAGHVPLLRSVSLDGGHAVNIDAADGFDAALEEFFAQHVRRDAPAQQRRGSS
jgi:pimeloyl-ACP methyl ester carboxylesterase